MRELIRFMCSLCGELIKLKISFLNSSNIHGLTIALTNEKQIALFFTLRVREFEVLKKKLI